MASVVVIFLIVISTIVLADESLTVNSLRSDQQEKKSVFIIEKSEVTDDAERGKRSPQFDDYYDDYSDYPSGRHLKFGHRRKKHRKPHLFGLLGGHGGCRGHGCGQGHGWRPHGGHYHQGPHGGQTFASASAGSSGSFPFHGGPQSHANAQSASFNLGPLSATFSYADAFAGNRRPQHFF